MLVDNPWQVRSIQAFSCLKCPECAFITKEENTFQTHAVQSHPLSYVGYASIFFGRLSSNNEILSPKSYRLSSNGERLSSNSERLSSNSERLSSDSERLSSNDERLSSNSESQKQTDGKNDNIKEHSIKRRNIINVYSSSYNQKSSANISTPNEETNSSQVNKTNEVENNLQEGEISDDMIEIKNEPLDEPIEEDPLQMGHPVTDTMGYPVTDSMGHPVIVSMGHSTNMPIKQDPLQIETDTMRHPANVPVIKLQMGRPVTEAMRHPVTETMGHPVTDTMGHPVTDTMGSVKERNKKRGYPFYVVCNPSKKIGTMNYSLSDAPVIPAPEEDKIYKCYECDKGFPDLETFNKHYESAHEWGKP